MLRRLTTLAACAVVLTATGTAATAAATATTAGTTTTVSAPASPQAGVAVTVRATVRPVPTGGTVAFAAGGTSIYGCSAVPVRNGAARCTTTLAGTGRVALTAAYSGTTGFGASSGRQAVTVAARQLQLIGGVGACTSNTGALVGVDFGPWAPPVVRGCAPHPTSGLDLLHTAGFTTTGDQRDGPAFVCRVGSASVSNGKQYPTRAQDACVVTPPAAAYWAYWIAAAGSNTWTYSPTGAASYQPRPGEVDAWVYGGTPVNASTPAPTFTPDQLRSGLPAAATFTAATPSGAADPAAASRYLAGALAAHGYLETFPGAADYGLTIDGALALAAAGGEDSALRRAVDVIDQRTPDAGGRTVDDWTGYGTAYASGGSIAKEALLAEATGYDPHSFGGHDLVAALAGLVCTRADTARGCAAAGNYAYASSVFAQAFGVIAQLRAGDAAHAGPAVAYLLSLQHADGSFPSLIPSTGDAEVDSTAMAVMALARAGGSAAEAAVSRALAWIASRQQADGAFPGAAGESTNSTALALLALPLGSAYTTPIDRARAYIGAHQNPDGGFAVGTGGDQSSDLRASTQALSGLVGTSYATVERDLADTADPAAAARWLVGQLVDGTHLDYPGSTSTYYGATVDAAFALAAAGGQDDALRAVLAFLKAHVAQYADPAGTGRFPGPYSGSAAKLAVLAEVLHQSPTSFGGFNLLTTLTDHVCTAPDDTGGCTAAGDFYQAFSSIAQSLGVLALARAHVTVPPAALARLLSLQCADGGFTSTLIGPGDACDSDADATGYAVQALVLVPSTAAAVTRATAFLRTAQGTDGGWTGTAGVNTNSTALAVQGLLAAGAGPDDSAVTAAQAWLGGRQNADGGLGISAATPASDPSATAQAVPAIVGTDLTVLDHALPSGGSGGGGSGGGSGGNGGGDGSGSGGSLANTGVDAGAGLGWGVLLIVAGSLLCLLAGRRRGGAARHRS